MKRIVIFASGQGSNAQNIIIYFNKKQLANVVAIMTNNPDAKVLEIAKNNQVPGLIFNKPQLNSGFVLAQLQQLNPDLIVLAGFLWQMPESIINIYPNKIINIHPALLPKYGGKGMYGLRVHQAVLDNNESETGITIHYVNKNYDEGDYISKQNTSIVGCTTAVEVASKVHELEIKYFPEIIAQILNKN